MAPYRSSPTSLLSFRWRLCRIYLPYLFKKIPAYSLCIVCHSILFSAQESDHVHELVDHAADEDNEEFVRSTITWDNEFSFQVDPDVTVLREDKMTEILDTINDENEQDMQLMVLHTK